MHTVFASLTGPKERTQTYLDNDFQLCVLYTKISVRQLRFPVL